MRWGILEMFLAALVRIWYRSDLAKFPTWASFPIRRNEYLTPSQKEEKRTWQKLDRAVIIVLYFAGFRFLDISLLTHEWLSQKKMVKLPGLSDSASLSHR